MTCNPWYDDDDGYYYYNWAGPEGQPGVLEGGQCVQRNNAGLCHHQSPACAEPGTLGQIPEVNPVLEPTKFRSEF